ncbi:MAG: hypothetical protein WC817_04350 [Patescibacteria group bacterium]|jgi:hypothetical protein
MTDERWQDLIGKLQDEGKIESKVVEDLEDRPGTVERFIVTTPIGQVRLSRTSQPRKIGEKRIYSKRASSTATVENEYDETDIVHVFTIERQVSGEWQELNIGDIAL